MLLPSQLFPISYLCICFLISEHSSPHLSVLDFLVLTFLIILIVSPEELIIFPNLCTLLYFYIQLINENLLIELA